MTAITEDDNTAWLALALSFFRKVGAMRYIAQAEELLSYLCRKRLNSPFPSP